MTITQPITPLGKIAAGLSAREEAREGSQASFDDQSHIRALATGLDPYIERMTSKPSAALARLEAATQDEDWRARHESAETSLQLIPAMLSGHLEGQFLATLIAFGGARRVLEIGLFTGYSALAMAEALPKDGRLVALEIDEYAARFAREHFDTSPHGDRITIRIGPAQRSLVELSDEGAQFDFVFIDADKPGYAQYYQTLLERDLLSQGGVIAIDNTLLGGEAYVEAERSENGAAIAAFNQMVADDPRTVQALLPIRDGVTLVRRAP